MNQHLTDSSFTKRYSKTISLILAACFVCATIGYATGSYLAKPSLKQQIDLEESMVEQFKPYMSFCVVMRRNDNYKSAWDCQDNYATNEDDLGNVYDMNYGRSLDEPFWGKISKDRWVPMMVNCIGWWR